MSLDGLHIDRQGDGPPVVLTHGFASSSATWAAQLAALSASHRVVAWDLRGHGRSPAPAGPYTREQALDDLAAVAASAAEGTSGPTVLVGHSLGGYLCLAHALARPGEVDGLVLISTGPGFRSEEKRASYNRMMEKVAGINKVPLSVAEVVRQRDSLVMDGLPEITCPAMLVIGTADHELYLAGSRYLAARLPHAELVEVDGAGHDVHVDRPEQVNDAIRRLAASLAAAGRRAG